MEAGNKLMFWVSRLVSEPKAPATVTSWVTEAARVFRPIEPTQHHWLGRTSFSDSVQKFLHACGLERGAIEPYGASLQPTRPVRRGRRVRPDERLIEQVEDDR